MHDMHIYHCHRPTPGGPCQARTAAPDAPCRWHRNQPPPGGAVAADPATGWNATTANRFRVALVTAGVHPVRARHAAAQLATEAYEAFRAAGLVAA